LVNRYASVRELAKERHLLDRAQREYPDKPNNPDDRWWEPAHLGGSAPTPESLRQQNAAAD